jgi:exodeoxyribonuclease VII large subunit
MQLDFLFRDPKPKTPDPQAAEPPSEHKPAAAHVTEDATEVVADSAPRIFTISELNRAVRDVLEGTLGELWVRGEVSNHRCQSSGHHYFSLKDASSQISCVLFAGTARRLRGLKLEDGREVQAFGRLSVYEARGQYQLVVERIQEEGLGALQAKFEALKARLAAEGLFDSDRKKPLPRFARTIGVVTSPTGAAIQDFLNVLHRRMPGIRVVIAPARVQGRGAAAEIVSGIRAFQPTVRAPGVPPVDVIVVTRGGGSAEDLWEFNEESVARAIADSSIPVVSAVGHEIDFSIADFVADLRAPTPSAAAEILAADGVEIIRAVSAQERRLLQTVNAHLRLIAANLSALERAGWLREPRRRIEQTTFQIDDADRKISLAMQSRIDQVRQLLDHSRKVLLIYKPDAMIRRTQERLDRYEKVLCEIPQRGIIAMTQRLNRAGDLLCALSPAATLSRGFTITTDAAGNILRSAENLRSGVPIVTRFPDGEVSSSVRGVTRT